ncbi:MAG: hypothetical protein AAFQ00_01395 [Pseudomonadota bacterium]
MLRFLEAATFSKTADSGYGQYSKVISLNPVHLGLFGRLSY